MENTILLVDDVRLFLEMQKEFLKNSPVNIITANNGAEALNAAVNKRPNLIFMDLEMPEMNGDVCCRAIKTNAETAAIPVVMITAKGDDASKANCRSAGCDDFLTKPLDRIVFLETARRFLADTDRRETRKPIYLRGFFRSSGTTFPCVFSDLSAGGAFVATDFVGETDRVVQLSIPLPTGPAIECQGKIRWFKRSGVGNPLGFGVSFILLPKQTKDVLVGFLKNLA